MKVGILSGCISLLVGFLIGLNSVNIFSKFELRDVNPEGLEILSKNYPWIKEAKVYATPNLSIFLPSTGESQLLAIFHSKGMYPIAYLTSDGMKNDVTVLDADGRTFLLADAKASGIINGFVYSGTNRSGAKEILVDRNIEESFDPKAVSK